MILYIHCKVLPLNTFVINAKANWTVLRIRGYLLHKVLVIIDCNVYSPLNALLIYLVWPTITLYNQSKLFEVGHHKHPFRLRYKGQFLKDGLTLAESKIFDTVSIELVPLATVEELQADLFWRYTSTEKRDEPHLVALRREKEIFDSRTKWLGFLKLSLMSLYPWCVLDFFLPSSQSIPLWVWGLAQAVYATVGLHFAPGFSYQSGWVGKLKDVTNSKYFDFFR